MNGHALQAVHVGSVHLRPGLFRLYHGRNVVVVVLVAEAAAPGLHGDARSLGDATIVVSILLAQRMSAGRRSPSPCRWIGNGR